MIFWQSFFGFLHNKISDDGLRDLLRNRKYLAKYLLDTSEDVFKARSYYLQG